MPDIEWDKTLDTPNTIEPGEGLRGTHRALSFRLSATHSFFDNRSR